MTNRIPNNISILVVVSLILVSCNGNSETTQQPKKTAVAEQSEATDPDVFYAEETRSEATAAKLRSFLTSYLKDDLPTIPAEERRFSFYEIDLNDDQRNEYFISLTGSAFCGSGGCTFLLLGNDLSVINRFTVMRPPVFRSNHTTNGWHDLILIGNLTPGKEQYRHLEWDNKSKKYPSNPSLITPVELAPSGHDYIMWDDEFNKEKVFNY